jgi:hypothetical protein
MRDDNDEYNGLIDDDPALDCILFEEMRKEDKGGSGKGGCLGMLLILVLPVLYCIIHFTVS